MKQHPIGSEKESVTLRTKEAARAGGKAKKAGDGAASGSASIAIDAEGRQRMIQAAAYHIYEQRGCLDGHDKEDWLAAEAMVDRDLLASHGRG